MYICICIVYCLCIWSIYQNSRCWCLVTLPWTYGRWSTLPQMPIIGSIPHFLWLRKHVTYFQSKPTWRWPEGLLWASKFEVLSTYIWRRRRTSRSSGKKWRRGGWKESPWMVSCAKRSIRNFFGTLCIKGHKICFQSLNLSLSSFIFLQISQIKKSNKMFQPWHACWLWAKRNYPVRRKSLASTWRWGKEIYTMTI